MATNYQMTNSDEENWKRDQLYLRAEDADEREAMRASGYMSNDGDSEDDEPWRESDEAEEEEFDDEDDNGDEDLDEFRDEPRDDTYDPKPAVPYEGDGDSDTITVIPGSTGTGTETGATKVVPGAMTNPKVKAKTVERKPKSSPKSGSKSKSKPVRVSKSGVKRPASRPKSNESKKGKKH